LSLYGDLEVSVIDELPPGRSPTKTRVYGADRAEEAHAEVRRALDAGRQAYVVFPLVEASDQLDLKAATDAVAELEATFAPHRVALLHGKMRSDEKSEVMQAFARGEVGVLVATTVIEVGVDVPNATVMVIEEADRFGLSQLHQLRGRVGRGRHQGLCLLVAGAGADAGERLSVMAETSDGFVIAERDLELRGPGEVLGTRQSGLPDLAVANLAGDGRLLEAAREAADTVLAVDPELTGPALAGVRAEVQRRFGEKLARMQAG
jgi:ATP-dependent DNA helicase RecG